jgi:membrane-associated phospholipid phosphatase
MLLTRTALKPILILLTLFVCKMPARGQQNDSLGIVVHPLRYTPRQLIVPGSLLVLGTGTSLFFKNNIKYYISREREKHIPDFNTPIDNYLQFAPIPIAYALDFMGFKSKTDIENRTAILIKAEVFAITSTELLKHIVKEKRPDSSPGYAFPSQHTSEAFTAATFLSEEYKDRFPWMPYVAYSMATATGVLRIANNKHYIGDVLFGAGLGILSTKVAYWTHQYKWGKRHHHIDYDYN